jgi:hypothetical protein
LPMILCLLLLSASAGGGPAGSGNRISTMWRLRDSPPIRMRTIISAASSIKYSLDRGIRSRRAGRLPRHFGIR